MGNKRTVEGGSALHAGEREGRRDGERGPLPPLTFGYAVTPLALRMVHGGKYVEYPLTVESALAIASDLTKMALWELRRREP